MLGSPSKTAHGNSPIFSNVTKPDCRIYATPHQGQTENHDPTGRRTLPSDTKTASSQNLSSWT
jgi:hypothetical protein